MNVFSKVFGTRSQREVKRIMPLVEKTESYQSQMQQLTDEQLRDKTREYKKRLAEGATLDDLLPEAFATVREAAKRVLGMEHYRVQIIGCDPQEQSHSAYQSVYHSSFCYPCAACYGCKEDEYEAGSPFPEEDGQPAQTVLQFLRRSSVGQAG